MLEGLFRAAATAAERINLFEQRGQHPRLGATDVIPLVPIRNITLAQCASLAAQLGERIGCELALPVYLYEAARRLPERRNLADVRKGEFERLVHADRHAGPRADFGPARVGPAGAVIVGARQFLIAYNFFLESDDLALAKAIARRIRFRDGGLPAVKALGLLADGRAQVSVNLVDHTQTPLYAVMDAVTRLAAEVGTAVERTELIGLIPEEAMLKAAAHYLKLPGFSRLRVVENAIQAASEEETGQE